MCRNERTGRHKIEWGGVNKSNCMEFEFVYMHGRYATGKRGYTKCLRVKKAIWYRYDDIVCMYTYTHTHMQSASFILRHSACRYVHSSRLHTQTYRQSASVISRHGTCRYGLSSQLQHTEKNASERSRAYKVAKKTY